jgi:hypothetical protein
VEMTPLSSWLPLLPMPMVVATTLRVLAPPG